MFELTAEAMILLLRLALVALLYLFLGAVALMASRELRRLARSGSAVSPAVPRARLIVVDPGATSLRPGEMLPLRPVTRLGRSEENTIILDDTFVSAEHAVIVQRDGTWWLSDRGSTNGTALNERQVHGEVGLAPGDVVAIGDVRLKMAV
ncbi:MAG TPA: FHA domain-containing protein [Chloroflexota bacterium]|nr:FHA domain-containing protein [Chloroflexota bacterium]